jgi:hypothetical protein
MGKSNNDLFTISDDNTQEAQSSSVTRNQNYINSTTEQRTQHMKHLKLPH